MELDRGRLGGMGSLETSWYRDGLEAHFWCLDLGLLTQCIGLGLGLSLEKNVLVLGITLDQTFYIFISPV